MHRLLLLFFMLFAIIISDHHRVCCYNDGFESTLGHLRPRTDVQTQTNAALDLIKRLIPERAHEFTVHINKQSKEKDTFHIEKNAEGVINITATTGVAAAWGFHHYLKYYCNAHISWEAMQLNLPINLPAVNVTITSNDRFRYYQNACTTSYSFVWWSWHDWQKHIDWMALNGINLALAFNGQEEIWRRVYLKLGLTQMEIDQHFTGPAFLSWFRMGNVRKWAGPLTSNWHHQSIVLQKQILQRMRDLGIIPVLPAFAGHVPRAFKRLFPDANMTKLQTWNNFEDIYCCPYLLNPTDPLFNTIGITFMQEQINEFGTDHVYNCDTFNEMSPSSGDVNFLQNISRSIYAAMTNVDSKAIWILQNWLFKHELIFWTKERAKALLTAVPKGRMIILDLQSEQFPQFIRLDSYFGQPFIWCMLHNFGGTLGMFGSADIINTQVQNGRTFENSTMIGTGLTPEGINQNYVIYDLMTEMSWRQKPTNLSKWFHKYAIRRYGRDNENATNAWILFKDTLYSFNSTEQMRGKYMISVSPRLQIRTWFWYNVSDFEEAWRYLLEAGDELQDIAAAYRHDVVDVTRQALQIIADLYYPKLIKHFRKKHIKQFQTLYAMYQELFVDLNWILSTNEAFLLGRWLQAAKSHALTDMELHNYEFNARNQILMWGPRGEIKDYANKQWAGVVSHVFGPRWNIFMSEMNESLVQQKEFDENKAKQLVFYEVESLFATDSTVFPVNPTGFYSTQEVKSRKSNSEKTGVAIIYLYDNSLEIARILYRKWNDKIRNYAPVTTARKQQHDEISK